MCPASPPIRRRLKSDPRPGYAPGTRVNLHAVFEGKRMMRSAISGIPNAFVAIQRMDRRSFLALGSAAATLTLAGRASAQFRATAPAAIRYVVTDRRINESLEFGETLCKQGSIRLEVTKGLTRLWTDSLLPLWRAEGGAVAGLTDPGVWNCISEQARSHMRKSTLIGRRAVDAASPATLSLVCWIIA